MKTFTAALLALTLGATAVHAQEPGKRLPEPPPPKKVIEPCTPPPAMPFMMPQMRSSQSPEELAKSAAAADAFLADNAKKPNVKVLPSGIQYRVLASGDPKAQCPLREDYIKIHYEGSLPDGTIFDSSMQRDEPAIFNLGEVIPGYGESVPYMHVGDEWVIYIPPKLGYGERGAGDVIPANSVLVFRIKLLGLLSTRDAEVQPTPKK